MSRYSNKQLITEIQNGNEEVLVYLTKKYFQTARRILRMKGLKDSQTPDTFSNVLIKIWMNILHHKFSPSIEFETFLFNSLQEHINEIKEKKGSNQMKQDTLFSEQQRLVVAQCVSILDETERNLIQAYYAEQLSFEKIADRFSYSNAVIAQHEVYKAMTQLEGIVKLRLNISLN
jgi:DNA-directed RNA polymerase specialized sigma24 family protein